MNQTQMNATNQMLGSATEQELRRFANEWAAAEQRADITYLDSILANDFIGIGPRGFMLNKNEWLQRHKMGDLKYESLTMSDMTVRTYGDAAIVVGVQAQAAKYQGQPVPGQFRTSLILVRQSSRWLMVGLQLSPIAGPLPANR